MSRESRMLAGIILVTVPTVMIGGLALLGHVVGRIPGYFDNQIRQDLWRAGHAHAGVYLILSLVLLPYVDEATLSSFWRWVARLGAPVAAILIPAGFFLSVVSPESREANGFIYLVYPGALSLGAAVLSLGYRPHSDSTLCVRSVRPYKRMEQTSGALARMEAPARLLIRSVRRAFERSREVTSSGWLMV